MLENNKKEENERWEEVREIKKEGQVWEVMNRERVKRRRINEGTVMGEWDRYFREFLGEVEGKVVRGERRGVRENGQEEISREELKVVLEGLREGGGSERDIGRSLEVWVRRHGRLDD